MSDTFILELAVKASPKQEKYLNTCLEAARHIYNSTLHECLKRINKVKASPHWKKGAILQKSKNRTDLFRQAIKEAHFNEYSLHTFVKEPQKLFSDHIDSATAQKIASKAFSAADEYLKNKRGRPRFKGKNQVCSVESKSNKTGVRFVKGKITWKALELDIIYNGDEVEIHGLNHKTKYVRLVKRLLNGKTRFYAQPEIDRVIQSFRKTLHGALCNDILCLGNIIKTEKLSYKGWQKVFGKSIQVRAPGLFINMLRRKAENAGGELFEFSPWKTKLSSTCHNCGTIKKKNLSLRYHECDCGLPLVQRDLYSAYLATHVDANGNFDRPQAIEAWEGAEPLLKQALSKCREAMSGKQGFSSLGLSRPPRQNSTSVRAGSTHAKG